MKHCIESGRRGKGSIYVWAAGNGGRWKGNTNFDGYVNQRYVMGVAAVDSSGHRPSYGEIGAANFITTASSGGEYEGGLLSIVSTTFDSFDTSACTRQFGGTSAAAPQVSAGVALMLSCRPDLTWRDVHSIIAHSGQVVDSGNSDAPWQYHTGLLPYSEAFGFGLLDFQRAVTLAKTWALLPPEKVVSFSSSSTASRPIGSGETVTFQLNVNGQLSVSSIENIVFKIDARFDGTFADMGSLKLTAPNGRTARLVRDHDVGLRSFSWSFKSPMWWDMNPIGIWNLTTTNTNSRKSFVIESIEMNIFGI
jgi:subtilisin family serine protease